MSEVNLSLLYYDKGYLSLVLALPVFKIQIIQIMLALLFDKKSEKIVSFCQIMSKIMLAQST